MHDLPQTGTSAPGLSEKGNSVKTDIRQLLDYCRRDDWAGYDPYDGLNSTLFQATPLRKSRFARLALIQFVKRCPLNLRPLLRIPKTKNAKGIALFTTAAIKLEKLGMVEPGLGKSLAKQLMAMRSPGHDSMCWGYPFDWQNLHFMLPAFDPNIICSTFGGNALLDAYDFYGENCFLEGAVSVAEFVRTGLNRTADGDSFCFSYTPHDRGQVHNANLLGAAFLSRVWRHTRKEVLRTDALASARYSIDRQRPDGSWLYGESPRQGWIDSFHTGYNLLAINQLISAFEQPEMVESMNSGYAYYRNHFFEPSGIVKYYDNNRYPIDTHAIAHGIITLAEFANDDPEGLAIAESVVEWVDRNMRSPSGYYYFQKKRWGTSRIPYIRWTQAWMLLALASMAEATERAGQLDINKAS